MVEIKDMLKNMLDGYGSQSIRITQSRFLCPKCLGKIAKCDYCISTGRLLLAKKITVIVDTIMEKEYTKTSIVGDTQDVTIKIYSDEELFHNDIILVKTLGTPEVYEIGSCFKERFKGGLEEAYISGARRIDEVAYIYLNILLLDIRKEWSKLEKHTFDR